MKKKNVLVIGTLGLLMFAGVRPSMVGGGPPPAEFASRTAIVVIENSGTNAMLCSAVVLGTSRLLTSGHCVEDYESLERIKITNALTGHTISRNVTTFRHPNYRIGFRDNPDVREIGADLAVLKLNHPVDFPVHAVRLPSAPELGSISSPAPTILLAAGIDEHGRGGQVKALGGQTAWYTSRAPGVFEYRPNSSGTGPCEQDSGGAIFHNNGREYLLMAVFSSRIAGLRCGAPGGFGYATAIQTSLGWLQRL